MVSEQVALLQKELQQQADNRKNEFIECQSKKVVLLDEKRQESEQQRSKVLQDINASHQFMVRSL
jgi:hypothetical protein